MKLTVLGNQATCPEEGGACSSFLLETCGKRILIDMGCGSLSQLQKYSDLKDLDLIVLSHLHFDHFGDIFCAKYQLETRKAYGEEIIPIPLLCPALPEWAAQELLTGNIFDYKEVKDHWKYDFDNIGFEFFLVPHLVESYAISITAENKKFVYSGDSGYTITLQEAACDADCFLCEATMVEAKPAEQGHHLSADAAGTIARNANVKKLLLTHYHTWQEQDILRHAKNSFENARITYIAESFLI